MKHLTCKAPGPTPKPRRRRTEETRGGFRLAAVKIMRRVFRLPFVSHVPELHEPELWQWNNPPGMHEYSEDLHYTDPNHLFPHL
jgi:hypothetical protein